MQRVLFVLRGDEVDAEALLEVARDLSDSDELAVCRLLPAATDAFVEGLRAQRETTTLLRRALGPRAERIAIFVAYEGDAAGLAECVEAWSPTIVRP